MCPHAQRLPREFGLAFWGREPPELSRCEITILTKRVQAATHSRRGIANRKENPGRSPFPLHTADQRGALPSGRKTGVHFARLRVLDRQRQAKPARWRTVGAVQARGNESGAFCHQTVAGYTGLTGLCRVLFWCPLC